MAVYYKFKSAKDYDSLPIDGHFITIGNLKERIFVAKHFGRGPYFDLIVTNAQSNEEYLDEAMLIPKNTLVLVRRIPVLRKPIVMQPDKPMVETKVDDQLATSNIMSGSTAGSSVLTNLDASDFDDEFGNDPFAMPKDTTRKSSIIMQDSTAPTKADEDSKIKALVESSGLDWQRQGADGFVQGRGFTRGGRDERGSGRGFGFQQRTPPEGYVCHRCNTPGHFIQYCPTNGDANYDIRKVKPPTGIPKTMLVPTEDGFYALPSGTSAVLKPDEAAFEKEIEGIPSTRSMVDLPPELHCPLCKQVMKDAVFTSKCCYRSYCDKCIRDYIMSKSMCACEAKNILADDLLPNTTVRDTINRVLESGNSSSDNIWSAVHVQDVESALCVPPKIPSPIQSAISKEEQKLSFKVEELQNVEGSVAGNNASEALLHQVMPQTSEKENIIRIPNVAEATPTHESARVKGHLSQSGALLVEEVERKFHVGNEGRKKKISSLPNGAPASYHLNSCFPGVETQRTSMQPGMDGYAGPFNYNPCWQQTQLLPHGGNMPYNMGYYPGPMHIPIENFMPPESYRPQNYMIPSMHMPIENVMPPESYRPHNYMISSMIPHPSQRDDAAEFHMGVNVRPPFRCREEFEARQVNVRRNGEMGRQFDNWELPRDRDPREHNSNTNTSSMKLKPKSPRARTSPSPDRCTHDYSPRQRERSPLRHDQDRNPPLAQRSPSLDRYGHDRSRRQRERSPLPREQGRNSDNYTDHRRSSYNYRRDRPSLEPHDSDTPRLSLKRKPEDHHSDCPRDCERDHEREHDRKHRRHRYHHRSEEGYLFAEPEPRSKPVNKVYEADESGSRRHQRKTSSSLAANGYNHHDDQETVRKNMAASMEYESGDDEQYFKRERRKH